MRLASVRVIIFSSQASFSFSVCSRRFSSARFRANSSRNLLHLLQRPLAPSRANTITPSVPRESTDSVEMSVLTEAFNDMLQQIQQSEAALSKSRDELEQRVEERTAELRAANRELEAFSYTVAHDLRGPLDSITGLAYLLAGGSGQLDPNSREMVQRLQDSTKNMSALIDDLLNFARASITPAQAGRGQPQRNRASDCRGPAEFRTNAQY